MAAEGAAVQLSIDVSMIDDVKSRNAFVLRCGRLSTQSAKVKGNMSGRDESKRRSYSRSVLLWPLGMVEKGRVESSLSF